MDSYLIEDNFNVARLNASPSRDFPRGFGQIWTPKEEIIDFDAWLRREEIEQTLRTRVAMVGVIVVKNTYAGKGWPSVPILRPMGFHEDGNDSTELVFLGNKDGQIPRNLSTTIGPSRPIWRALRIVAARRLDNLVLNDSLEKQYYISVISYFIFLWHHTKKPKTSENQYSRELTSTHQKSHGKKLLITVTKKWRRYGR